MVVGFVQSPPLSRPCQYILVVVTPVQVFLLALTFSEDDVTKPLTIVPTGISCSTDGVGIVHAVGTNTGRIFLGGEDGCLYELGYHHNDSGGGLLAALMGDRPTKARKTNHTASVAVMALQALIGTRFLSPGLPLVRLAIDHDRSLLYTLSVDGEIKVRHGDVVTTAVNPGEGAFYGPKFEYVLRDAIGRDWQCGTTQVDFNLPGRFGAFYIGPDSDKVTPVMVHRAMFGSLERFTGILIEHYAGHMPLWLSPLQVVVATITQEADDYAMDVVAQMRRRGLRVEADLRNEKITYKVREHSLAKVPVLVVVGRKEGAEKTVSIRRLGSQAQTAMSLEEALNTLSAEAVAPDQKRQ